MESREQSELASISKPVLTIDINYNPRHSKTAPRTLHRKELGLNAPTQSTSSITTKPVSISNFKSRSIGIVCVTICIITWIAIAELEPVLFAGTAFSEKPFFLQYVANSMLILCIVPWAVLKVIDRKHCVPRCFWSESLIVLNAIKVPSYQSVDGMDGADPMDIALKSRGTTRSRPSTLRSLVMSAIMLSALNSLQNYLWLISLFYTIVAVNTTIYQSQCVFVLLLSVCILGHKPTAFHVLSVIVSVIGVVLISCFGAESEDNPSVDPSSFGVALCLIAAVVVALMQVMMHRVEQRHFDQGDVVQKLKDMLFFQFLMGVAVLTLWWPGFIVLDVSGIEPFVLPQGDEQWMKLIGLCALSLVFLMAYLVGITFSGALFISVGTLMVVPVSYVVDVWLYDLELSAVTIAGTVCVVIGFLLMQKGSG